MKKVLFVSLVLLGFYSSAQMEKTVLGSFSDGCNTYNYEFKRSANGLHSFQVNKAFATEDSVKKVLLNAFEQASFVASCKQILEDSLINYGRDCEGGSDAEDLAKELFFKITARLGFVDDEPATAVIRLKGKFIKCISSTKKTKLTFTKYYTVENLFEVKNVSVEFEDGTIKNIFCKLQLLDLDKKPIEGFEFVFKNIIPISISGRNDLDLLDKEGLFIGAAGMTGNQLNYSLVDISSYGDSSGNELGHVTLDVSVNSNYAESGWDFNYKMLTFAISDLIEIEYLLESGKEDYSPANGTVELNVENPFQELKKEKRSQILSLRVFSDLAGVQGDQPNGLIQIEANKKFNLLTNRSGWKGFYWGWLTYVNPTLTFSKIEENNSTLIFDWNDLDTANQIFQTNAIDLFKYQSSSFDVDLNLYKVNIPKVKSNLQLNLHGGVLRTDAADSVQFIDDSPVYSSKVNTTTLNSFRYGASAVWQISPDSRYGLKLGYGFSEYRLLSDRYKLVNEEVSFMQTMWAEAFLKTSKTAQLFFRYRFSFTNPAETYNYVQVQLGYNMNLFKTK